MLCVGTATAAPLRQLYEGYVAGSAPERAAAEWARDQRQFAFVKQDPNDNFNLKLVVGDPAVNATRVVQSSDNPGAMTWLRKANTVAYAGEKGVWSVNAGGGLALPIDPGHSAGYGLLRLSPDGTRLAYIDSGYNLDVVNVDGTGFRQLWSSPDGEIQGLSWSPDSSRIVVDGNDGTPKLFTVSTDGSGLRPIAECSCFWPAWSPGGSAIATVESPIGTNDTLRLIAPDGSRIRTLATSTSGTSIVINGGWNPDNERIVFAVYLRTSSPS
ncbi:MAG: hypothetical protein JO248_05000 [Acidimicrobiia bacterium]|nr:hypothetical protein [Acidimicrobiia bacterium]